MLFIARLVTFLSPPFVLIRREVSKVRMRRVTALEVDWASEEAPDLAETPLNLVLLQDMQEAAYPECVMVYYGILLRYRVGCRYLRYRGIFRKGPEIEGDKRYDATTNE